MIVIDIIKILRNKEKKIRYNFYIKNLNFGNKIQAEKKLSLLYYEEL